MYKDINESQIAGISEVEVVVEMPPSATFPDGATLTGVVAEVTSAPAPVTIDATVSEDTPQ